MKRSVPGKKLAEQALGRYLSGEGLMSWVSCVFSRLEKH